MILYTEGHTTGLCQDSGMKVSLTLNADMKPLVASINLTLHIQKCQVQRVILYSFGEARDVKYPLQIIYILPILFQWDVFERLEFTPHLIRLYMLYIKLYVGNLHDICTYLTHVFSSECF